MDKTTSSCTLCGTKCALSVAHVWHKVWHTATKCAMFMLVYGHLYASLSPRTILSAMPSAVPSDYCA
eukprot:1190838-Prorocentrum_minimum.AAC.4